MATKSPKKQAPRVTLTQAPVEPIHQFPEQKKKPLHVNFKKLDATDPRFLEHFKVYQSPTEAPFIPASHKILNNFHIISETQVHLYITPEAKKILDEQFQANVQIPNLTLDKKSKGSKVMTLRHYHTLLLYTSFFTYIATKTKKDFNPVAFQNLRHFHVDYVALIDHLKKSKIIQVEDYTFSEHDHQAHRNCPNKFKVIGIDRFLVDPKFPPVAHITSETFRNLCVKINQKFNNYKESAHGHRHAFYFHEKTMPEVNAYLRNYYHSRTKSLLKKKKLSLSEFKTQLKIIHRSLLNFTKAIVTINTGNAKITSDSFGHRRHSPFTVLPKEIRKLLNVRDAYEQINQTVELDLKSSQVAFAAIILPGYFENYYKPLSEDDPNGFQSLKAKFNQEMLELNGMLLSGEFYKKIGESLSVKTPEKDIKGMVFSFIFAKQNRSLKYVIHKNLKVAKDFVKFMFSKFPEVTRLFRNLKFKDHRTLAKILQRSESKFMGCLARLLNKENIPFIVVHDSVIVPLSKATTSELVLNSLIEHSHLPTFSTKSVTEEGSRLLFNNSQSLSSKGSPIVNKLQSKVFKLVNDHSIGSKSGTAINTQELLGHFELVKPQLLPRNSKVLPQNSIFNSQISFLKHRAGTRTAGKESQHNEKTENSGKLSSLVSGINLTEVKVWVYGRGMRQFKVQLEKDEDLFFAFTVGWSDPRFMRRFEQDENEVDLEMVLDKLLNLDESLGIFQPLSETRKVFRQASLRALKWPRMPRVRKSLKSVTKSRTMAK